MLPLYKIKQLSKYFGSVAALSEISLEIFPGETLGIVGESGSGKSTLGKTLLRLHEPTSGEIWYQNQNLFDIDIKKWRKKAQMIFQDPYSSLNPRMSVKEILEEPFNIHHISIPSLKIEELLELVGLSPDHKQRYPHEFSGGQRQRIGIARAIALNPELIVCDEPVSALDVSIQAQIINLLKKLQKELGLTYLFISHDLSLVKYLSDRIAVMHQGKIVELAPSEELYQNPQHPYTKELLSAIPIPDPKKERERRSGTHTSTGTKDKKS